MKSLMKRLRQKSEELGWNVTVDKKEWTFQQHTPAGEDFFFYVTVENLKDLWREVRRYANDFDPDEHIQMWVEAKQNGRTGIPSIRELVEDADEIDKMMDELADALREATEEEDE